MLLGMQTYPDRSSSLWLGPISCRLVSQLSRVQFVSPSSVANCQLLSPFVSLSSRVPLPTSGHKGIVCLANHLGLAKNYRCITLTSIAAKIYNALLRNRIEPKIDNILRKNQNGFRRNRSTTSQILTIRRILEGVRAKNLQATLIFVDFTKAFDSIHRGKM